MHAATKSLPFVAPPPPPLLPRHLCALPGHARAFARAAQGAAAHFSPVAPAMAIQDTRAAGGGGSGGVPRGCRVVHVRGDGRCLFRAIAKNLAAGDARVLSERLETADADALRKLAWDSVCVKRRSEFVSRHIVEGPIESYCQASRSTTFYGGEPELLALSDILRRTIRVYLKGSDGLRNIVTYGEQYTKKTKVVRGDGAIRILYVNGNHYDAILPR